MRWYYLWIERRQTPVSKCHRSGRRAEGRSVVPELGRSSRSHSDSPASSNPAAKVRQALAYTSERLGIERPLAHASFQTDGVDLLVEKLGKLINVSQSGQLEMATLLRAYLKRIKRDSSGLPVKLYPFTRMSVTEDAPAPVEINPRVAFGRPVIVGSAVPTAILADRFKAGDTLVDLSKDYEISKDAIEEAIRCELDCRKAA